MRKLGNMRVTLILIVVGMLGTVFQRLGKGTGRVGNQWANCDNPN